MNEDFRTALYSKVLSSRFMSNPSYSASLRLCGYNYSRLERQCKNLHSCHHMFVSDLEWNRNYRTFISLKTRSQSQNKELKVVNNHQLTGNCVKPLPHSLGLGLYFLVRTDFLLTQETCIWCSYSAFRFACRKHFKLVPLYCNGHLIHPLMITFM